MEGKYGRVRTDRKEFPDDEPLFLVRAQDKLAPMMLAWWASSTKPGYPARR